MRLTLIDKDHKRKSPSTVTLYFLLRLQLIWSKGLGLGNPELNYPFFLRGFISLTVKQEVFFLGGRNEFPLLL